MNNVVLIGRLTRDPELRYIPNSGAAVTNFTLAVDKQLPKDKKDEMEAKNQPTADFIRIVVWGKMAENCANYLAKGRLVAVQGRIQTGSYDAQDGSKRYTFEVVANNVEFLEWGDKNQSNQQQSQGGSDDFSDLDGLYQPVGNDDIPF
ncbi:MAG TPA: single-stranded DNA-binding protein [Tissierellaceae bacterium]